MNMDLSEVVVHVQPNQEPHLICEVTVENAGDIVEGLLYHAKNSQVFQQYCEALMRKAEDLHRMQEHDKSHALAQEIERAIKGLRGQQAFIDYGEAGWRSSCASFAFSLTRSKADSSPTSRAPR